MPPGTVLLQPTPCPAGGCGSGACRRTAGTGGLPAWPVEGPPDPEALTAAILARLRAEGLLGSTEAAPSTSLRSVGS